MILCWWAREKSVYQDLHTFSKPFSVRWWMLDPTSAFSFCFVCRLMDEEKQPRWSKTICKEKEREKVTIWIELILPLFVEIHRPTAVCCDLYRLICLLLLRYWPSHLLARHAALLQLGKCGLQHILPIAHSATSLFSASFRFGFNHHHASLFISWIIARSESNRVFLEVLLRIDRRHSAFECDHNFRPLFHKLFLRLLDNVRVCVAFMGLFTQQRQQKAADG